MLSLVSFSAEIRVGLAIRGQLTQIKGCSCPSLVMRNPGHLGQKIGDSDEQRYGLHECWGGLMASGGGLQREGDLMYIQYLLHVNLCSNLPYAQISQAI